MAPRDGSNIYSQPFPDVVEDTTIESTVYNGFTNDVAADLNAPRPIVAGGTGAGSATDARFNLATEAATQIVTNYDDHLWVPGSFRSTSSATNPPVASHSFAGWCYINEALANPPTNQNVVVHAFDFDALANTALLYTRQKKAGVWSDWNITTTADNQAGARQAIYAAPFDALAYNGMQINGSMDVHQEGVVSTAGTGYICDGWQPNKTGSAICAFSRSIAAITDNPGFKYFISVVTTTPQPTMLAGDLVGIQQQIEGYRILRLGWGTPGAQPLTIGFWAGHGKTGTYSVALHNATSNRNIVAAYTHSVVGWEYHTITFPGDTVGPWVIDNGTGIIVTFANACGSTYTAPALNVWSTTYYYAAPSQVNNVATLGDTFRITGVVVLPGIEAPSAARSPLIMRPFDHELLTCQRYYNRLGGNATSIIVQGYTTAGGGISAVLIPPSMRATPAVSESAAFNRSNVSAVAFQRDGSVTSVQVTATATGGVAWYNSAGQYLVFDARL